MIIVIIVEILLVQTLKFKFTFSFIAGFDWLDYHEMSDS